MLPLPCEGKKKEKSRITSKFLLNLGRKIIYFVPSRRQLIYMAVYNAMQKLRRDLLFFHTSRFNQILPRIFSTFPKHYFRYYYCYSFFLPFISMRRIKFYHIVTRCRNILLRNGTRGGRLTRKTRVYSLAGVIKRCKKS